MKTSLIALAALVLAAASAFAQDLAPPLGFLRQPKLVQPPIEVPVDYQRAHRNIRLGIAACGTKTSGSYRPSPVWGNVYSDLGEADLFFQIGGPGPACGGYIAIARSAQGARITGWVCDPTFGEGGVEYLRLAPLAALAGAGVDCARAGFTLEQPAAR